MPAHIPRRIARLGVLSTLRRPLGPQRTVRQATYGGQVNRFRMRPRVVDAMQFDGSVTGVERVIAWARTVAPDWPVRPRTEYIGWEDLTGHLELEVMGMEQGAMSGDWLVVTDADDRTTIWFLNDATFHKYYEAVGA
jgi:hypothetical protein